jgi:hypothetical protein
MSKLILIMKKYILATLIVVIGISALPSSAVSASGLQSLPTFQVSPEINAVRLEQAWSRAQNTYQRQGNRLERANIFIQRVQLLIDKATQKGWDSATVQTALDAFSDVIPVAESTHSTGAVIITRHAGFDTNGKVTDRTAAIASVKALVQVLKDTSKVMNGTRQAVIEAIIAFRESHKPGQAPFIP